MFEAFRVDDATLHVVVDPRAFSALHVALNAMDDSYNTYGDGCVKPNAEVTQIAHELATAIDKALEVGEGAGNPIGMARTCESDSTGRWIRQLYCVLLRGVVAPFRSHGSRGPRSRGPLPFPTLDRGSKISRSTLTRLAARRSICREQCLGCTSARALSA